MVSSLAEASVVLPIIHTSCGNSSCIYLPATVVSVCGLDSPQILVSQWECDPSVVTEASWVGLSP